MPHMSAANDGPARIDRMATILKSMSDAMNDQSSFHVDHSVTFGVTNLKEAAVIAARRALSAPLAGPRQLREMERTVLFELAQATLLGQTVIRQAGSEMWPELEIATAEALVAVRDAACRDITLLGCTDHKDEDTLRLPFAEEIGGDWRRVSAEQCLMIRQDGIALSANSLGNPVTGPWLARMGDIPVGITDTLDEAAHAAEAAGVLFAPVDEHDEHVPMAAVY